MNHDPMGTGQWQWWGLCNLWGTVGPVLCGEGGEPGGEGMAEYRKGRPGNGRGVYLSWVQPVN